MSNTLFDNDTVTDTTINLGFPYKVILFNDETHNTFEVENQIRKAINCNLQTAHGFMMEAHETGRVIVFYGLLEKCELVESVLSEIKLGTKLEPA
jgi:ATP-dependent Clp protease adaptor protein ClpS